MTETGYNIDETLEIIGLNKKYFDKCLNTAEKLVNIKQYDLASKYLDLLAKFSWGNLTGYYTNWKFESLLNRLGDSLPDNEAFQSRNDSSKFRILHVASDMPDTGGHTRLIMNWIRSDQENTHNVIVTRQENNKAPEIIIKEFGLDVSIFHVLKRDSTFLQKAAELRERSYQYDMIIMHLHPEDIIPVIAYSCKNIPPIAVMNVGDHQAWVGASVCDLLVQFRDFLIPIDKERRGILHQYYLPLSITSTEFTSHEKYIATRKEIGIAEDETLLLSTGIEYKFKPFGEYNFFESVIKVLDKNKKAKLYIAGISKESQLAKKYAHHQITYLGTVTDLYRYEDACDISVEGFPWGGATAILQCALKGKPIHLIYNPTLAHEFIPKDIFYYPENEKDWENELNKLIADKGYRTKTKDEQHVYLQTHYNPANWSNNVKKLYRVLSERKHSVYQNEKSHSYIGRNEYYLFYIGYGLMGTNHFLHCYQLPILSKIKHASYLFNKPPGVRVGKRALLNFIFS